MIKLSKGGEDREKEGRWRQGGRREEWGAEGRKVEGGREKGGGSRVEVGGGRSVGEDEGGERKLCISVLIILSVVTVVCTDTCTCIHTHTYIGKGVHRILHRYTRHEGHPQTR